VLPAIIGAALQEVVDVVTILNSLRAGKRKQVASRNGTLAPALLSVRGDDGRVSERDHPLVRREK
jgi:hypothetical protein